MDPKPDLITYSVSLEELALAFALINAPALSRRLLNSAYENDSPEITDARLTSASHALLAGDLCHFTASGALQLDPAFEQAVFALAKYTTLIEGSLIAAEGGSDFGVALGQEVFTARLVHSGVVQVLTHGPLKDLPDFLAKLLEGIGEGGSGLSLEYVLTPEVLEKLSGKDESAVIGLLKENGWPEKEAGWLAKDLGSPKVTATLVHVPVEESTLPEAGQTTLLLVRGEKNSWAFHFQEPGRDVKASIRLVDRKAFEGLLAEFIS